MRRRLLLALGGLLLALLGGDLAVRQRDLDLAMLRRVLYYQEVELPVHRVSDDPVLRYELRPGASFQGDRAGRPYTVTIGSLGQRGPDRPVAAAPGTTRVLFTGASTIYGVGVSDHETLPARLEAHLGPGAEVWNLGVSAYVETQELRLARRFLAALPDVDLVLVMVTNPGRRPLLVQPPLDRALLDRLLAEDPGFLPENVPAPPGLAALHPLLFRGSAAYRYGAAFRAAGKQRDDPALDPLVALLPEQQALRAEAAAAGARVAYVHYPRHRRACPGCWRGEVELDLDRPGLPPAATDLHPAAEHLDAHAARLAALLRAGGLAP